MDFLPQTKCQLIGFVVYILVDSVLEYYLGKTEKIKASSKLELCILAVSAAVIAVASLFKREKPDGKS